MTDPMEIIRLFRAPGVFLCALLCLNAAAESNLGPLPADVTLGPRAGRGGWIILNVRVENSAALPFVMDTGSPITLLDPSLKAMLGKCLVTTTGRSPAAGRQPSGIYAAPRLFLGGVQLKTDSYVATYQMGHSIKGLLGMDCLRHYCIQLDCAERKLRFLAPDQVHPAELGKGFPLIFSSAGEHLPQFFGAARQNQCVAMIHHSGLLGGTNINLLIDTGDNVDGGVEKGTLKGHLTARMVHFFLKRMPVPLAECTWDHDIYTNLQILPNAPVNRLGLRFLARHLVTFDFPGQAIYIKRISSGPLP